MIPWQEIISKTNEHGYMSGIDRMSDRVAQTHEIFTPTATVIDMMKQMLEADPTCFEPGKTILDPACGDGQLLVPVKWFKVLYHGMTEETALQDIYGVDIMRDNIDLCRKRLINCAEDAPAYATLYEVVSQRIIMGNTLDPLTKLDEQTEAEAKLMLEYFGPDSSVEDSPVGLLFDC
jgi:SAM-dependent methyltransferase